MNLLKRFFSQGDNVFVSFLSSLEIKFTHSYSKQQFNEHPHKYNLYGLSRLLSDYHIENAAAKIENKEDIDDIQVPFVAQTGGEFVVVKSVDEKKVVYIKMVKWFGLIERTLYIHGPVSFYWQKKIMNQLNRIIKNIG